MRYKLFGFAVWQGGKWYARRRLRGARSTLAVAGLTGMLIAGAAAAKRRRARD